MKFTFGPLNRISAVLYLVALPLLAVSFLDHSMALGWFEGTLRLQLFVLAIIIGAMAALINLGTYIYHLVRESRH